MSRLQELGKILSEHGLKRTTARLEVLKRFSNSKIALSQPILEKKVKNVDRTTLYRILSDFVRAGILHPVVSSKGVVHYSLCHDHCDSSRHFDNHVHFECLDCNSILCLTNVRLPKIKIGSGIKVNSFDYKVIGTCSNCNDN
ncbi:MAG: transcriptional repressor [Bacteroidia bacterium]|nr:transcriptional repressor [Bacteroidia bacterium]